jgi:hypothetical protein
MFPFFLLSFVGVHVATEGEECGGEPACEDGRVSHHRSRAQQVQYHTTANRLLILPVSIIFISVIQWHGSAYLFPNPYLNVTNDLSDEYHYVFFM